MRKTSTRITVIFILIIVAVVGYYAYLSNKRQVARAEATLTLVDSTLVRNLVLDYPPTPKEVLKYYNDILKCLYNEECTEDQITQLGDKARELYDEELLEANEPASYLLKLKSDISEYKENKRRITNCAVAASTSVDFYSLDDFDFARIACGYTIMEGANSKPTNMIYLLRRDENKMWKIYGWELAENVDLTRK